MEGFPSSTFLRQRSQKAKFQLTSMFCKIPKYGDVFWKGSICLSCKEKKKVWQFPRNCQRKYGKDVDKVAFASSVEFSIWNRTWRDLLADVLWAGEHLVTIVSAIISSSSATASSQPPRKGKKWPPISFLDVFSTSTTCELDTTTVHTKYWQIQETTLANSMIIQDLWGDVCNYLIVIHFIFRRLGQKKKVCFHHSTSTVVLKWKERNFLSIHQIRLNPRHTDENRPNGVLTNCESSWEMEESRASILLFLPSWNSLPLSYYIGQQEKEIRVIRRGDKRKCAESFSEIGSIISQQRNEKKGQLWAPLLTLTCFYY